MSNVYIKHLIINKKKLILFKFYVNWNILIYFEIIPIKIESIEKSIYICICIFTALENYL